MEPLLEQINPNGNVQATVESDGRAVYFYLYFTESDPGRKIRACWVRNLDRAPDELNVADMKQGRPPLLPETFCKHPDGAPPPDAADLSLVWFEEGNGAALLEQGDLLAVIPPWSGLGGFEGYARDCTGENPLCWPLPEHEHLRQRLARAQEYWRLWDDADFWQEFSGSRIEVLERTFGAAHAKYYAIDAGKWPPKTLLRFDLPDRFVLATVGVALRAQPNVEMSVEDPAPLRRIELAAAFDRSCPEEELQAFGQFLSGLAGYPWNHYTWLGHGHTVPCKSVPPSLGGGRFPFVLLCQSLGMCAPVEVPDFRDDPVSYLWLFPITREEADLAVKSGSEALMGRLAGAVTDCTHADRPSVVH